MSGTGRLRAHGAECIHADNFRELSDPNQAPVLRYSQNPFIPSNSNACSCRCRRWPTNAEGRGCLKEVGGAFDPDLLRCVFLMYCESSQLFEQPDEARGDSVSSNVDEEVMWVLMWLLVCTDGAGWQW